MTWFISTCLPALTPSVVVAPGGPTLAELPLTSVFAYLAVWVNRILRLLSLLEDCCGNYLVSQVKISQKFFR